MHHHARGLMVDMRKCKGRPSAETLAWRDDVTVPKYIRAGMEKLARLLGCGVGPRAQTVARPNMRTATSTPSEKPSEGFSFRDALESNGA